MHPKISIDLRLSDHVMDLYSASIELAIRIGALQDLGLITWRIMDNQRILVASPDYLAQHGPPKMLDDLSCHRLLIFACAGL